MVESTSMRIPSCEGPLCMYMSLSCLKEVFVSFVNMGRGKAAVG